MTELSYGHL
jgi:hypothetical protein